VVVLSVAGAATYWKGRTKSPVTVDGYVGLTEPKAVQRAKDRNEPYRIVRRDDKTSAITLDLQPNRVNFEIDDGIVTKAEYY